MRSGGWLELHGWRVKRGTREYCFLLSWDLHRLTGGEPAPELVSTWDAEHELQANARDATYLGGSVIEKLYFAVTRRFDLPSLSPRDLEEHLLSEVLQAVRRKQLVAFEVERSVPPQYSEEPEPPAEQPAEERPRATFEVQVVLDVDGSPVGQLSLGVKEPASDEFRSVRTDDNGTIQIAHTVQGMGEVRGEVKGARLDQSAVVVGWGATRIVGEDAPPSDEATPARYVVRLEEYRVKDGDTVDSVSARAKMSWKDLAYFNWGAVGPEEINHFLTYEVGSAQRSESGAVAFKSSDQPGIIRIPRCYSKGGPPLPTCVRIRSRLQLL